MPPRRYVLHEANYGQLRERHPDVAVLPWGATEAHNYHMPHGSDIIEATALAEAAAQIADEQDARVIVLPPVPFGSNAQQLDQVATIHLSTPTMAAILHDVTRSLMHQGIDRLVILNSHGGNELKGLVRDVQAETGMLIVVINFWQIVPDQRQAIFDEKDFVFQLQLLLFEALQGQLIKGAGILKRANGLVQILVFAPEYFQFRAQNVFGFHG